MRDKIASLVRQKHKTVVVEKRLLTTTADIFYVDDTNAFYSQKIAIESKDWKRPLTRSDIADIYNLYSPAISNREIDFLIIIGNEPLSSSPRQTVDELKHVQYATLSEFSSRLMNFSDVIQANLTQFERQDSYKNYIDGRVRGTDEKLIDRVEGWLGRKAPGMVIYGGYGSGKTTFSHYLAATLSQRHMRQEFSRIPIRFSLGGMYHKQDLVSLICSTLGGGDETGSHVRDFDYRLFIELNRQGQYVLIFDGFDEMRHAMDISDFIFTFEQMGNLFDGNSKILILGRPDSFLTNIEEQRVLSSLDTHLTPDKVERVEVALFSKAEIRTYIDRFISKENPPMETEIQSQIHGLIDSAPDSDESIFSRPVQLKMFTKTIHNYVFDSIEISKHQLYKNFIYGFVEREGKKQARRGPTGDVLAGPRNAFMQNVAWWILTDKKENRFLPSEIRLKTFRPNSQRAQRRRRRCEKRLLDQL